MSVAIVSEAFERRLLGGASAVGARFSPMGAPGPLITVVGGVGDSDAVEKGQELVAGPHARRIADESRRCERLIRKGFAAEYPRFANPVLLNRQLS